MLPVRSPMVDGGPGSPSENAAPGRPLWLCTDLDGTLLGGTPEGRVRLRALLAATPGVQLIFVSGRGLETILPLLNDPGVPSPDWIIADVGGTVVSGRTLEPVQPLQSEIDSRWPGAHAVLAVLEGLDGLERQDVPQERRCSFYTTVDTMPAAVQNRVAHLGLEVLHSAGRYLDVLPAGVDKGTTLTALLAHLHADRADVLVAGDTLNDLAMFTIGLPGVVVGNAEPALREATRDLGHVLQATEPGADGILDALRRLRGMSDADVVRPPTGDASLVIVYHRLPFDEVRRDGTTHRRRPRSPNGIIPTITSLFGGGRSGAWVAWSNQATREPPDFTTRVPVDPDAFPNLWASRIALTGADVDRFYKLFSKEALWPVIFSFLGQAVFRHEDWAHFVEINRLFALRAAAEAAPGALVWVHDYNLWMVPAFLRPLRPDVRIAFFHHTSFPPPDVFNVLPWRREIAGSLLQCDYIGCHIPRYAENVVEVLRAHAPVSVLERAPCAPRFMSYGSALGLDEMTTAIHYDSRVIRIGAHPVGVDVERIATQLAAPVVQRRIKELRAEFTGVQVVLSLERLDYVKGPLEKLHGFELLLEQHPELHGRVVLVNTCTPPAEGMKVYASVRQQVDRAVGRINGRFSRLDWTPVRYLFRSLPFDEVIALYAAADVAWITPLRDGLNLVAKEFVATKGADGTPGTLVLSEFAGAAVELHGALLTNPYDPANLAAVLHRALVLDPTEQHDRLQRLLDIVRHHDHADWSASVLKAAAPAAS